EDGTCRDVELSCYRLEAVREADDALNPYTNEMYSTGLLIGRGNDWSRFSSNNWAMYLGTSLLETPPYLTPSAHNRSHVAAMGTPRASKAGTPATFAPTTMALFPSWLCALSRAKLHRANLSLRSMLVAADERGGVDHGGAIRTTSFECKLAPAIGRDVQAGCRCGGGGRALRASNERARERGRGRGEAEAGFVAWIAATFVAGEREETRLVGVNFDSVTAGVVVCVKGSGLHAREGGAGRGRPGKAPMRAGGRTRPNKTIRADDTPSTRGRRGLGRPNRGGMSLSATSRSSAM
ncbi:hypothetical protein HDZ31DRAFT_77126, partial [Schizophyllum fasciatum]